MREEVSLLSFRAIDGSFYPDRQGVGTSHTGNYLHPLTLAYARVILSIPVRKHNMHNIHGG